MGKINISLPDGMLEEIDRRASAAGATRSGFLQDAAGHYLTALDEEAACAARAKRVGHALQKMRSLAPVVGAPGSAKAIREIRDAPSRWEQR
ncbi:MAG: type II toxin-antitoxin system HicB family antitoxin [Coriobacteriia bacterium]